MKIASVALLAGSLASSLPAADVVTRRITFAHAGETMVGTLFLPAAAAAGSRLPTVIVEPPFTQVKEQVASRYARGLAERGFVALAFDHRFWGESGGAPRYWENPAEKIADLRAAVAFLRTLPGIDSENIYGVGVCFGASYMAALSADVGGLRAWATVAAWLNTPENVAPAFGGAERFAALLRQSDEAWAAYRATGELRTVPTYSETDPWAAMGAPAKPYYGDPARGAVPAWPNRWAQLSWRDYLALDGVALGAQVQAPLLMIHTDHSGIPDNARKFFDLVRAEKELNWTTGEHLDFYDRPAEVEPALDRIADFFRRHAAPVSAPRVAAIAGVREFFAALEEMDIPRFLNVWADDGVQEMPYAPGAFPRRLAGKAALERQYGPLPAAFVGMKFTVHRLEATAHPGTVLAEFQGSIALKNGGRYDNTYVGVFEFNAAGKLARYVEYFDPYTLVNGFPGAAETALPDSTRIERLVTQLARSADARDWAGVRAVFADEVDFDYTSVAGGQPARLAAAALVAGWEKGLSAYRRTKHNFSDIVVQVTGDRATATFTGQATHQKPDGARWSCGGDYTYEFTRTPAGWKATTARFAMRWEQGAR